MFSSKKNIILIIVLILILLLVLLSIFFNKKENIEIDDNKQGDKTENQIDLTDSNVSQIEEMGEDNMNKIMESIVVDNEELYTKQLAKIFTERFNTYSNQNDNVHIEEVKSLVTDSMYNWIKTNALDYSSDYEGVTSQVLSSEVLDYSDESAEVLLGVNQVWQKESDQGMETKKVQKDARVELVKEGDEWLVDGFYWE